MKILLINTELYSDLFGGYKKDALIRNIFLNQEFNVCPPLGLLYIASYIRKHNKNICIRIIDLRLELIKYYLNNKNSSNTLSDFLEAIIKENINQFSPDVICQSILFDASSEVSKDVSNIVKALNPNIKIIMGGYYPNNRYDDVFSKGIADFVCIGEGEAPLSNLVKYNFDLDLKIKGIISRKQFSDGNYDTRPDLIIDLDEIPWPAYDLLAEEDMKFYIANQFFRKSMSGKKERTGIILSSRGCLRRCTFCAAHSIHGRRFRKRSAEDVVEEIKYMVKKYNLDSIAFHDDTFTFEKKRTIDILEKLISENLDISLQFPNGIDIRTIDEEIISLFKKAKVNYLHIAIESGNQYMQYRVIKKSLDLEKVKKTVDLLLKYDLNVSAFFIIGFPEETIDMINETKAYAKDLGVAWIAVNTPTPVYGSELYEECLKKGIIPKNYQENRLYGDAFFSTKDFSSGELARMIYDFNIEVNFLYNEQLKNGIFDKMLPRYIDITIRYPTHIIAWICLYYCYKKLGKTKKQNEALIKIINLYKKFRINTGKMEAFVTGNAKLMFDNYRKDIFNLCPEFEDMNEFKK